MLGAACTPTAVIAGRRESYVGGALLFLLVLLVYDAPHGLAEPINPLKNPHICGRPECPTAEQKFRYNTTVQYTYSYRTHVRTEFLGSGQNQSDVYVDATAVLTFPSACEGLLRLRHVQLRDEFEASATPAPDRSSSFDFDVKPTASRGENLHPMAESFATAMELNELRFAYHDGRIDEVCPHPDEATWVLNYKKGVLSVLQNSMRRFDVDHVGVETDVTGTCEVAYRLLGAEQTRLLLHKEKDLKTCTNRYKTNSYLQTVPYQFRQNIAVWPILKSTSSCNISVDHNIYSDVRCYERHQLEPFSNRESGAVTHSYVHLLLEDEQIMNTAKPVVEYYGDSSSEESGIPIRTTLLFDHYPTPKHTHGEVRAARDLLIRMCSTGFPNIQREFIEVFTQFLHTARQLSYGALDQLLARSVSMCGGENRNGRYHVLESLPHIGSSAAVRIMCTQIAEQRLPVAKVHNWLSSIVLLPRPDEDMLDALLDLARLADAHLQPKYVLVATAVAHTFCRNHADCEQSAAIRSYVHWLEDELLTALQSDARQRSVRERVAVLLKGIGNVGVAPVKLAQLLLGLVQTDGIPIEYRLNAVYAHIRLNCRSTRNVFLAVYENQNENAEVRIAAYQQVMRCPSKSSVKRIKSVLQAEEVNQVGSYVWSSLSNLAKSASPLNVEVQSLLVDEELSSRFKLDLRKFSRNFEQSLFFDEYNVGTRFDANLIFGTESFLPRAIGFNVSADLFGESVNLFEVSTRMEGLEQLAEKAFGPSGIVKSKYFGESMKFLNKMWSDRFSGEETKLLDKINVRLPKTSDSSSPGSRSSIPVDRRFANESLLAQIYESVRSTGYSLNYTFDHPRVSIATKMFGNDIGYHTLDGDDELLGTLFAYNPVQQLRSLFSGRQVNYTKSGVMMDIAYDVPLGAGLPLSIHAFGATSVDLRLSGALTEANLQRQRLAIAGRIRSNAALEIMATMRTDYFVAAAGIRVKANMYTSSAVDASLRVALPRSASLQFSLPQDRNDIFSATSELLVIKRNVDVPQSGIAPRYANATCTWSFVDRAVGLKICSEYSVPDVNSPRDGEVYPSLLLSGPVSLNIHMDKADVSAKTFLFEYRWNETASGAAGVGGFQQGSLSFHTPGSRIVRMFSANVTRDPENYNVTMSFQNGPIRHQASGTLRMTDTEKRIDVFLILDGKKNLACEVGLNWTAVRNGWMYIPLFVLSINDERIAGLTGTVKATMKKNIAQYDLNLTFETKRAQAELNGYITKTEFSTTPKLTLSYRFHKTRPELIELAGELSSRGQKSRTEYNGNVRLNSTAYPHFNFASNMKFISVLGHVEATMDFNNAVDLIDPNYLLTLRLIFVRVVSSGLSRTSGTIEVTRPRSNVDFTVQLKNEERHKNGVEHNVFVLVRVAPQKQGTATLSVLFPRGQFFAVDAALNVTVPTFDPCTVTLRWIGTKENEYTVDFRGAWFTGHKLSANGLYQDISTQSKVHRHLKLLVTSPHFNETNTDLRFWRDEEETSLVITVEHGSDPYALKCKHSVRVSEPQTTAMSVKVIDKVYSVQAQLVRTAKQQLLVEIHLDNVRDIHIALRGHSTAIAKEFGIDIQWDANRDPTQKIELSANLNTPHPQHTDGGFVVAYPDRSFSGTFDLDTATNEWTGNARVGWSASEAIAAQVRIGSTAQPANQAWLLVHVTTPFEDWHSTRVRTDLYYHNGLLRTNGSLSWAQAQRVAVALRTNYVHTDAELLGEFHAELNSTVYEVPNALASLKHHYRGTNVLDAAAAANAPLHHIVTDVHIRHSRLGEPTNVLSAASAWTLAIGRHRLNRTVKGSVRFRSPLAGYRLGGLYAKFGHDAEQRLSGAVAMDLESSRYRAYLDGYAHRLTDNMFSLNVTTPIEKFSKVVCRLGASDRERHAVAEVRLPASALGVEMLWAVDSLSDFDVLLSVETPLEAFQRVRLVAKMRRDTVDLRGAWNRMVVGYVGVWRMVSYRDVEYSYRVFTPLENFAENGVVVKFVQRDGIDVEVGGRLAAYKMGIVINAKPKPALRTLVGTQPQRSIYFSAEASSSSNEWAGDGLDGMQNDQSNADITHETGSSSDNTSEDDEEEEMDDDVELFNYVASLEVDTVVWPTIVGQLEIDEIEDDYIIVGTLKLPQGSVSFKDRFEFPDYFNITNTLKLTTPFSQCSELQLKYTHDVDVGIYYTGGLDLVYRTANSMRPIQVGATANYSKLIEPDQRAHQLQLTVRTPLKLLELIQFHGRIEHDENAYRTNVTTSTPDTRVSVAGTFEAEPNYLDTALTMQLTAPAVPQLNIHVFLQRDLSHSDTDPVGENRLEFGFAVQETEPEPTHVRMVTAWRPFQFGRIQLLTNLCDVHALNASVGVQRPQSTAPPSATSATSASAAVSYRLANGQTDTFQATASRNHDLVTVALYSAPEHFGNVTVQAVLTEAQPDGDHTAAGTYNVHGTCTHNAETPFPIAGIVIFDRDLMPERVRLQFRRPAQSVADFSYDISTIGKVASNVPFGKSISIELTEASRFLRIAAEFSKLNTISWRLTGSVRAKPVSNDAEQRIDVDASVRPNADGQIAGQLSVSTPWQRLGIDAIRMQTNVTVLADAGELQFASEWPRLRSHGRYTWTWQPQRDMQANAVTTIVPLTARADTLNGMRFYEMGVKYVDNAPTAATTTSTTAAAKRVLLGLGVRLNVNNRWNLQSNATWRKLPGEMGGTLSVRLPDFKPANDVHKFSGQLRSNLDASALDLTNADVNYDVRYETDISRHRFASRGQYRNVTDLQGAMRVEWGIDAGRQAAEANVQMLRKEQRREFSARVATPWHVEEDSLVAGGYYDKRDSVQMIKSSLNYPASRQIANTDITFTAFENMKGYLNCSTPFTNLTWIHGHFDFFTTGAQANRYLKATWPADTAIFDLRNTYASHNLDRDLHGTIKMSVPLATRHTTDIVYGLKDRPMLSTGNCAVRYNNAGVLDGHYTCKYESRAGYDREVVDITLQNPRKPLGISYEHVNNYANEETGIYDMKRAEVFDLKDHKKFNITGEFHVRTTYTGQEFKLVAVHPNRTPVVLTTMYDLQERTTSTRSKLQLSDDVWLAYNVMLQNQTTDNLESRSINLELSYPRRNLSTSGWYAQTEHTFDSDVTFQWTNDQHANGNTNDYEYGSNDYDEELPVDPNAPKTVQAALQWRRYPSQVSTERNQTLALIVHHPSFEQNVTFRGGYRRNAVDLLSADFRTEYCVEPEHALQLNAVVRDWSAIVGHQNITFGVTAVHAATELDLSASGSIAARTGLYEMQNEAVYKRSYLPVQEGFLVGKLDVRKREIHFWKSSPHKTVRLWAITDGMYPVYRLNASFENSPDVNSTGRFYANIDEKFVQLHVNMTPDAAQNLRMVGTIPDARSATFDLWRDYDEFRVVDVAYYLRMNHSRLVTSKLVWRPSMRAEVKAIIKETAVELYDSVSQNADYWLKTVYSESKESVRDIWESAKPYTDKFLNDVSGLQVLEHDLEEFRLFVNQSYEANDFYVKSMVNITLTVLDELSLRNHIDSVPKILSELWQMLGETGLALKKSIIWVMESLKTSYNKALEIIGRIFKGNALEHVTELMEKGIAKYDKMVKDLHVSFIKYVEQTWYRIADAISNYWQATLRRIEPALMQFLHYMESIVWNVSKEVFDFLYKRTNEIVDSPYFARVSNFTQDMDTLYRDIMSHDIFTNIRKYSALGWQFLRAKYFAIVPFGHELNEICTELVNELRKLYQLEPVQFMGAKVAELQAQATWFANELQVEKRAGQLWNIVRQKITTLGQTALQTDDKYREAKTQFVFDPDVGLMELQQKLPMSWHAFNETPIVEEIQEYRTLLGFTTLFQGSNVSLWSLYYDYQQYMDPVQWLPPYKTQGLLIGQRHFMTFDDRFVAVDTVDQCSYLLAHDFLTANFTLIMRPLTDSAFGKQITLISDGNILNIVLNGTNIHIMNNQPATLPLATGDIVISRDIDQLHIESTKGFTLSCNLRFGVCWFELTGWYFGRTSGILGNMNNELHDDYSGPHGQTLSADRDFINSWALRYPPGDEEALIELEPIRSMQPNDIEGVRNQCEQYFHSKLSPYASCFGVVDTGPYMRMCLDLVADAVSTVSADPTPTQLCSVALAYIETCERKLTPLRVPDVCINCQLINGSFVPEGTFIDIGRDAAPSASDVVFIVEAKECNRDVYATKNLGLLIGALQKELVAAQLTNNRYAVLAFGASSVPFDTPRSVIHNNVIFTESHQLKYYFEHVRPSAQTNATSSGHHHVSTDIFEAIGTAAKLTFRPGASKSFVLLPCSAAHAAEQQLDYSSVLQQLREDGIQLHVLMDPEFRSDKKRLRQAVFGIDRRHAYTKHSIAVKSGGSMATAATSVAGAEHNDLRQQIGLPKAELGLCAALAMESAGSIFTASKLRTIDRNPVKKFVEVFGRRVAESAATPRCQTCECTGHNSGMAYMTCTACHRPNSATMDVGAGDDGDEGLRMSEEDYDIGEDGDDME